MTESWQGESGRATFKITESWQGSQDPEIESGRATFKIGGEEISFKLQCFRDFQSISRLLRDVRKIGNDDAVAKIRSTILTALGNIS